MNRVRRSYRGGEPAGRCDCLRSNGFQISLAQQSCRDAVIEWRVEVLQSGLGGLVAITLGDWVIG